MSEKLRFDGRVAIVTGAGGGMGRAYAHLLAERGASVIVNELPRSMDKASSVVEEIRAAGGKAIAAAGRIGVEEDARGLVDRALSEFGRIDIVVNNAGTAGGQTLVQDDPGPGFQSELDVHCLGPLQLNRAAWPHMVEQGYGRIAFTSSAAAMGGYFEHDGFKGSYSTAKAAVLGAAKQTAAAGAGVGIKVNIIMPWGYTPLVAATLGRTEFAAWMESHLDPAQVARSVLLLFHESCPVNGQAISTAGGRVTRVMFATTVGYFNPELSPEDVLDNWQSIEGSPDPDGLIEGLIELRDQPHEYELLCQALQSVRTGGKARDMVGT